MKSNYLDPGFARYWEERCGHEGQSYQRFVLDPLLFSLLGTVTGLDVLELGCGNGYLARQMISREVSSLILLDLSEANLTYARAKTNDRRVRFLCQDATTSWAVEHENLDIIMSNMMLNEVEDIHTPIREAYRVLRPSGRFVFSIFHPGFDLFVYAQKRAGIEQRKIRGIEGYFARKYTAYDFAADSKTSPELAQAYQQDLSIPHFHRPVADYFDALTHTGFIIKRVLEPEVTPELLAFNPRFAAYQDRPVSMVFSAVKG